MTVKDIRHALQNLSAGLEEAYKDALERIESQKPGLSSFAKRVLSWITCARRPLTLPELRHALATKTTEPGIDEDAFPDADEMVSICAGLVTVDQETNIIRLIHTTTREYFESIHETLFPSVQREIAITCLNYLSLNEFADGCCTDDDQLQLRLENFPFLTYASQNWGNHARKGPEQDVMSEMLGLLAQVGNLACSFQVAWSAEPQCYPRKHTQSPLTHIPGLMAAGFFDLQGTVKLLLQRGVDIDSANSCGQTTLHWVAGGNHDTLTRLLLDRGANVNASDNDGKTALHEAAGAGNHAVARLLLDHGADIEARDKNGATALHYGASGGHDVLVRLLFEYGADVDACEITTRDTALHLASTFGHRGVLQSLLSRGADVEVKNTQKDSALHCAIDNRAPTVDIEIVRALVYHGSMVVDQNVDNMTPLHLTVKRNREDVAALLLQSGFHVDTRVKRKRWSRTRREGVDRYDLYGEETAIDHDTVTGLTPLHAAAMFGRPDMVKFLLKNQADPNALNEQQQTPLHLALGRRLRKSGIDDAWTEPYNMVEELETIYDYDSEADDGEIFLFVKETRESTVNALLNHPGINLEVSDYRGQTPLHVVKYGERKHSEVVNRLLSRGSKIDAQDHEGRTALHLAAAAGDHESLQVLLSNAADPTILDHKGQNALHYAARCAKSLDLLLQHGVGKSMINSVDSEGRNTLHHALDKSCTANVKLLLNHGVDIECTDHAGRDPLAHYICLSPFACEPEIIRLLVAHGANARRIDSRGLPLCHLAVQGCLPVTTELLEVFAEYGMNMDAVDKEGKTILHHGSLSGSIDDVLLRYLLDTWNIDINAKDNAGKTAIQYAQQEANRDRHPRTFNGQRWARTVNLLRRYRAIES